VASNWMLLIGYKSSLNGLSIGSTLVILSAVFITNQRDKRQTSVFFNNFQYYLLYIKMNDNSQETLHRVEQNDETLKKLSIGSTEEGFDFSRLGLAIATNTQITKLDVYLDSYHQYFDSLPNITDTGFYDGLRQNTSISNLFIDCCVFRRNLSRVGRKILQTYQENNNHLTTLNLINANLQDNEGAIEIATTLQCCVNLTNINLYRCGITAGELPPIEAMRGSGH